MGAKERFVHELLVCGFRIKCEIFVGWCPVRGADSQTVARFASTIMYFLESFLC